MLLSSQIFSEQWLLFDLTRVVDYLVLFSSLDLIFSIEVVGWLQQATLLDSLLGVPPFSLIPL
jgi:hypothetical protein